MAKVSSAPEDAFHFKGTFEDGWGEVVNAKSVIFQYPPNKETGKQDPPGLFVQLDIERHRDGEGNKIGTPPEEMLLSIQRAGKESGVLDTCHPGDYPDGNLEADPIDKGGELGAEGNTLFATQDGYQINDKTKWMSFTTSLQEKGFKPAILKRTYFPDLIGLRAYFKTETRKKFRDDQTTDPTVFIVTEIKQFPYEKGAAASGKVGAKKPAAAKAAATPASPATPAAAPAAAAPATAAAAVDPSELATAIVQEVSASTKGATLPNVQKLKLGFLMGVNAHKPPVPAESKKAVIDQLSDVDWLIGVGAAYDLFTANDDGSIKFKE